MSPSRATSRRPSARRDRARTAPAPPLEFAKWIVWEDDALIAVNKPAGILSQGGEGGAGVNLVDLARAYVGRGGLGVLHRIDRNVSGVVLIAKTPQAARAVSRAMQRGEVVRVYDAVVLGSPAADAFAVDAWLRKNEVTNEVVACNEADLGALGEPQRAQFKPARTEVQVMARWRAPLGACAALEVRPITGRSHQIRVHLAHVGLPIVGDPKYGVAARDTHRPLLHARCVEFAHPTNRSRTRIEAPRPWSDASVRSLAP